MSKPLVTFPDPEAAVVNRLKAALLPRAETYKPATVTTTFPPNPLTKTPLKTHVQVEMEAGDATDYPVTERAQVRVTCWAPNGERAAVKNLASLAQGLLYTHPGDDAVAGVEILIGRSDVITDTDTGYLMCWFLARVNLKATLLAS